VHTDTRDIKESPLKVLHEHKFDLSKIDPFLKDLILCIGEFSNLNRDGLDGEFYESLIDPTIRDYIGNKTTIEKKLNIGTLSRHL